VADPATRQDGRRWSYRGRRGCVRRINGGWRSRSRLNAPLHAASDGAAVLQWATTQQTVELPLCGVDYRPQAVVCLCVAGEVMERDPVPFSPMERCSRPNSCARLSAASSAACPRAGREPACHRRATPHHRAEVRHAVRSLSRDPIGRAVEWVAVIFHVRLRDVQQERRC
jgi:hypothetical protein